MGEDSYGFIRALFGLIASGLVGAAVALATRPQPLSAIMGLVAGTQLQAMEAFKGGPLNRREGHTVYLTVQTDPELSGKEFARFSTAHLATLAADPGDLLYVCDQRWWLGGLRSVHTRAGDPGGDGMLLLSPEDMARGRFQNGDRVYVEKVF